LKKYRRVSAIPETSSDSSMLRAVRSINAIAQSFFAGLSPAITAAPIS
jgi:hypothetical protein